MKTHLAWMKNAYFCQLLIYECTISMTLILQIFHVMIE